MKEGIWVLHFFTGVIDQVKYVWSGEGEDVFVNPSGQRIEGKRVVELDGGDAFIDTGEEFSALDANELGFLLAARRSIEWLRSNLVEEATKIPLKPHRTEKLLASEFRRISK